MLLQGLLRVTNNTQKIRVETKDGRVFEHVEKDMILRKNYTTEVLNLSIKDNSIVLLLDRFEV